MKTSVSETSVLDFLFDTSFDDLPAEVVAQGQRCLLDLIGVGAGGAATPQATIVREHVATEEPNSGGARMLFDGRRVSIAGAAWAGASAIESLDAHDGHSLTKGHAGVALLPGILAVLECRRGGVEDEELLVALVKGYELALRCGIVLHATAPDYHSSGAWNSVGVALVASHLLGATGEEVLHAAGVAEYFGPRGPMMRCIAEPSMVKDSSAWGARVGVEAAQLARRGFTGRPAELLRGLVGARASQAIDCDVARVFGDLGERWRILEQYFKPHPVCRWAQPAVEAVLDLKARHGVSADEVDRIEVRSFLQAVALDTREPRDTEQAQYSLPYAVAAALRFGRLGAEQVQGPSLGDVEVLRLSRGAVLREVPGYSERFPAERLADVTLVMHDGRRLSLSGATCRGEASEPLTDGEISAKFHELADPVITPSRASSIVGAVRELATSGCDRRELVELLLSAVTTGSAVSAGAAPVR